MIASVEVDFAMLGDSISVALDGKLTIVGAGVDGVVAASVPAQHASLVVVMRAL